MGGRGSNRTPARWLAVAVVVLLVAGTTLLAERRPASAPVGWSGVALARAAPGVPKEPAPRVADTPSPTPTPDRSATPTPTPTATPTPEPPATPPVVMPTSPVVTPTPTIEPVEVSSPRSAVTTGFVLFATVAGIDVHHPTDVVERVGFHQSNHEGARDLQVYDTAAAPLVLPSRDRLSGLQSAADVVVDPAGEVRAPVSGVVVRAGSYNLYCDLYDDFVVIAPDVRPEWEVKILHIVDVGVTAGDRVEGGITPIAATARLLPFASQVDEWTAEPSWPHTHIEVVDPSIENVPNGGSGYEDC